jgi:RNA polymerase sigma factor (sigma-70 family)
MENNKAEKFVGKLFNECFHSLVFKSFGIVKDYDLAKDIVQDVFVKIWQNYQQLSHISDLKPYIFKAVQNSSLNYMRNQKNIEFSKLLVADLNLEYQDESDEIEDKEIIYNRIHQAVEKLPEKWHKAFVLSKYEKLKYYEIAEK